MKKVTHKDIAKDFGIGRTTLYKITKKLGIPAEQITKKHIKKYRDILKSECKPRPKKVLVGVRLDPYLLDNLKYIAKIENKTLSAVIRDIIYMETT